MLETPGLIRHKFLAVNVVLLQVNNTNNISSSNNIQFYALERVRHVTNDTGNLIPLCQLKAFFYAFVTKHELEYLFNS